MTRERASVWSLRVGITLAMFAIGLALGRVSIETLGATGAVPSSLALAWGGYLLSSSLLLGIAWSTK